MQPPSPVAMISLLNNWVHMTVIPSYCLVRPDFDSITVARHQELWILVQSQGLLDLVTEHLWPEFPSSHLDLTGSGPKTLIWFSNYNSWSLLRSTHAQSSNTNPHTISGIMKRKQFNCPSFLGSKSRKYLQTHQNLLKSLSKTSKQQSDQCLMKWGNK